MKVVLDAGVVFSGAGRRGEAHRCLLAMAQRRIIAYATEETLKELSHLFADRGGKAKHSIDATLSWYQDHVKRVEPAPLGKQRSRDAKDDPYLACTLGAGAKIIVTRDDDLLTLGKPRVSILILRPAVCGRPRPQQATNLLSTEARGTFQVAAPEDGRNPVDVLPRDGSSVKVRTARAESG